MAKIKFPTRAQFREFLEAKKPGAAVGRSGQPCDCPIAGYFRENGASAVAVYPESSVLYGDYEKNINDIKLINPAWARRFIVDIDSSGTKSILKEHALRTLNNIIGAVAGARA